MLSNQEIEINYILRNNPFNDKKIDKTVINKLIERARLNPKKTKLYLLKDSDKDIYSDNFTLSDESAYRYENDTKNYIAFFSFKDKEKTNTSRIREIFNILQTNYSELFPVV